MGKIEVSLQIRDDLLMLAKLFHVVGNAHLYSPRENLGKTQWPLVLRWLYGHLYP